MEIGVLPSHGEHYLSLILYDVLETTAVFSIEEKARGKKIGGGGRNGTSKKVEPLAEKFITMDETRKLCDYMYTKILRFYRSCNIFASFCIVKWRVCS